MIGPGLRVAIVGCGLIGHKRAAALRSEDVLVGATDPIASRADALVQRYGGRNCSTIDELLALEPDVAIVATTHDQLTPLAERALRADVHVLVEKPAGLGTAHVERLMRAADDARRLVKVGFNHRFHPAISQLATEVHSGRYGELLHLRARYGHGGRVGYDREWRADPAQSGGGELIDQGMHLLDLTHWIAGALPLHCALLRTHFWETEVEDNAALILGAGNERAAPWAMLHVTWTEWDNMFSIEVYCRTAKLQVDGLVRSYGTQRLRIYRMRPGLGPPDLEERAFPDEDVSWNGEWDNLTRAIAFGEPLLGSLEDAHYAWSRVQDAYGDSPVYSGLAAALSA
jgi:predicted dehydrogenase